MIPKFSVHQVNVWNEKEVGPTAGLPPMPNSLLFLPSGYRPGQPGPAVLFAHRWAGYAYEALPCLMGPRLAEKGYGFLSVGLRRRGVEGQITATPDDDLRDVKLGVDYLSSNGFTEVLLVGEEIGALTVARYQAKSGDVRVRGVAMLRPFPNLHSWMKNRLGAEQYAKQVRHSVVAARQGVGTEDLVDLLASGPDGRTMVIHQFSGAWLAWWSRAADTLLDRFVEDIRSPILIVPGVDATWAKTLQDGASSSSEARVVPAGDDESLCDVLLDWVGRLAKPAGREPDMEIVDVEAANSHRLVGFLWTPSDERRTDTAILYVHGMMGTPNNVVPTRQAAVYADSGLALLAVELRRSGRGGHMTATFGMAIEDIDAFVRLLAERGYTRVVLVGHSLGSITITRYHVTRHHPNVVALVHLAPTADCAAWARLGMGEESYLAVLQHAKMAVAAGKGETELIDTVFRRPNPDQFHMLLRVPQRANSWLSWWGDEAPTNHLKQMPEVDIPVFLLSGSEDSYNDVDRMNALYNAALRAPAISQTWYGDCDHFFLGFERQVAIDTVRWLEQVGVISSIKRPV